MDDGRVIEIEALNGTQAEARIARLEQQIAILAWLHAEQAYKSGLITKSVASLMAREIQPRLQQAILKQLGQG